MAKYGAKNIKWAPKSGNGYGAAISLGKLIKVSDSPKFSEGKLYADNALAEYVSEFVEADLTVETSDIPTEAAAAIFGATVSGEGATATITYGSEDAGPYGGLAFISCKVVDGVKSFVGVFYPQVKGVLEGDEYETKGENMTFATGKLKMKATANAANAWKIESEALTTEAAAQAWINARLGA